MAVGEGPLGGHSSEGSDHNGVGAADSGAKGMDRFGHQVLGAARVQQKLEMGGDGLGPVVHASGPAVRLLA